MNDIFISFYSQRIEIFISQSLLIFLPLSLILILVKLKQTDLLSIPNSYCQIPTSYLDCLGLAFDNLGNHTVALESSIDPSKIFSSYSVLCWVHAYYLWQNGRLTVRFLIVLYQHIRAVENLNFLKILWSYICHIEGELLEKTR